MADDKKLWKIFSTYIRLRDSDENGIAKCITCSFRGEWKRFDCGHGVGRQYKATKYDERNNHAQCARCNAWNGGEQVLYKEAVEKKYGEGTWNEIVLKSRQVCKRSQLDIDLMEDFYKKEVEKLKKIKG